MPAPPAETSDQTTTELAELRQLRKERSPITNTALQYYNAVPATQRWHDLAFALARAEKHVLGVAACARPGILFTGKYVLEVAVALLGTAIDLPALLRAGPRLLLQS